MGAAVGGGAGAVKYIIQCSDCGAQKEMDSRKFPGEAVAEGWGSLSTALYCPVCSATWHERNEKPMSNPVNTLFRIVDIYREQAGVE